MNIFKKGAEWDIDRVAALQKSEKRAWLAFGVVGLIALSMGISIAVMTPLRRTIPVVYVIDKDTGTVDVLQSYDSRVIPKTDLVNKYWAQKYVLAREQYNWWLLSTDYEFVARTTTPDILAEYTGQFVGDQSLDKVFGPSTERRIKILSVVPAPAARDQMIVRFERTTVSKGSVVEVPTIFSAHLAFKYAEKTTGSERELIANPLGYSVYAYRRDVEQQASAPVADTPRVAQ